MSQSQKSTGNFRFLTNTFPFGRCAPSAATAKLEDKLEQKLKLFELIKRYGTPASSNSRFEIIDFLGEGTFGRVMKCVHQETKKVVALKAFKARFGVRQFMKECNILRRLNEEDPEKFHIVRLLDSFSSKCQGFLVFDLMEQNLFQFLTGPLCLPGTLYIMNQLLSALTLLKKLKIVHTDIKLENILLVNNKKMPLHIQLADFNSAVQMPMATMPRNVQPLFYRAPEVTLGLPYEEEVDMWSAGCLFAEMLLGSPLYPATNEYTSMKFIHDTQGMPSDVMLNFASNTKRYYRQARVARIKKRTIEKYWRIKTVEEYADETGEEFSDTREHVFDDLSAIFQINASLAVQCEKLILDESTVFQCTVLLKIMLAIDPDDRISPESALNSTIISDFHDLPEDVKRIICDEMRMKLRQNQ